MKGRKTDPRLDDNISSEHESTPEEASLTEQRAERVKQILTDPIIIILIVAAIAGIVDLVPF